MDTLFSLPVLSLFLIPTTASYTTSLNFIFFYMTWSTLVFSHSPLRVELFGTVAVRLLFYVLPSLLFFLFDILTPSAAMMIKVNGEGGLPSGRRRGKIRLKDIKIAGWGLANVILSIVVQAIIEKIRISAFGARSSLKVSIKLPMPWEMTKDLLRGLLVREGISYAIHRFVLHSKDNRLRIVTEQHQLWYHSLRTPFPLTAHYDHPLVYLLANFIPTYMPGMLFRFHMLTYLLYMSVVSVEETFAFSGYTVMPTSFFLSGMARRTEIHLFSGAKGNFGPWGILDWICGTNVTDDDDVLDEPGVQRATMDDKVKKAVERSTQKKFYERHRLRRGRRDD
ncbi:sterol desaturase family protein [Aspergillus tanneri]|uniref:Fatty acid hydroxylase domain-containing protein n=1 Tax=Aspergillus tanneri TaxID=1220188 RepID=A0A5M9N476_9EURO|nr:uncharacterized protein ATNIH1004_000913 [Aspergillus tanneri]KAA8652013.1 hypothetical protein ATNIH1004_000913 [Aspergillus tanneri]